MIVIQVLKQLPAKEETIETCSMSEKQRSLYQSLFTKLKRSTSGESEPHLLFLTLPQDVRSAQITEPSLVVFSRPACLQSVSCVT